MACSACFACVCEACAFVFPRARGGGVTRWARPPALYLCDLVAVTGPETPPHVSRVNRRAATLSLLMIVGW
jgi:hypothetical protein